MPVLVHVFAIPARTAVPLALPIVGVTAAAGAIVRWRRGQLRLASVALFAAFAMGASFVAARLGAGIPDRPRLLLFGTTMLVAAFAMWRRAGRSGTAPASLGSRPPWQVIPAAVVVGALTGILGVGGGFLIVPALVGALGLTMPEATATSLAVIALNAAAAGVGYLSKQVTIDAGFAALVTGAALVGMAIGLMIAPKYSTRTLGLAFAIVLVIVAAFTIGKELLG